MPGLDNVESTFTSFAYMIDNNIRYCVIRNNGGYEMGVHLELMVKYLVHQQFYSEDEGVIYSRDKSVQMRVPGAKQAIESFIDSLMQPIDYLKSGSYRKYLEHVKESIPFDVDKVEAKFAKSVKDLDQEERSLEIIANFLVGAIRSDIQTEAFESQMSSIRKIAVSKLETDNPEQIITERLSNLYAMSNSDISMLYSLALLEKLVKNYGDRKNCEFIGHLISLRQKEIVSVLLRE